MRKSLKAKVEEEKTSPVESENDDSTDNEVSVAHASSAAKKRKSRGKVAGPRIKKREAEKDEEDEESKESFSKESNDEDEAASLKTNKKVNKGRRSAPANNDEESLGKESSGDEEDETASLKKNKRVSKGKRSASANNNDDEENVDGNETDSEIPLSKKMKAVKKSPSKNGLTKAKKRAAELEETEEYEVESVVGCRFQRGKRQFRIRWKGFKEEDDTWENEDGLDCTEAINEYLKDHPESNEKPDKKTPKAAKKADKTKAKIKEKIEKEDESEEDNLQEEYEVDRIKDVFIKKNGKREFLIRWKGYGAQDDTWEPEEHLNCTDLIKKYEEKITKAKSVTAKDLRVSRKPTERFTLTMVSQGRRVSRRGGGKQRIRYDDAE